MRIYLLLVPVLMAVPLLACSNEMKEPRELEAQAENSVAAAETPEMIAPGLLLDPRFEVAGREHPLQHWRLYQHAGDSSYEFSVADGELSLRRNGPEPWGVIQQDIDLPDMSGKTLEFSAEFAAELDDSYGPAFDATGLTLSLRGFGPSDLPMLGKRILLAAVSDPGLAPGSHDWQRLALRFEVPEGADMELRLGLQLTHGGELRVRAPRLVVVEQP